MLDKPEAEWQSGDMALYNATEERNFDFVVNGKNSSRSRLQVDLLECIQGVCAIN